MKNPLVRGTDPRIRIRTKTSRITNTARNSVLSLFFFLHQPSKKAKLDESSDDERFLVLKNGARMPRVQFGTYRIKGTGCLSAVLSALRLVSQTVGARYRFFLVGFSVRGIYVREVCFLFHPEVF
jgi:hypothetical protein